MTTSAASHIHWPARDLRAGALLTIGWIALALFFVLAVAQPAARLHSIGEAVAAADRGAQR